MGIRVGGMAKEGSRWELGLGVWKWRAAGGNKGWGYGNGGQQVGIRVGGMEMEGSRWESTGGMGSRWEMRQGVGRGAGNERS